jgi:hypothetical protein
VYYPPIGALACPLARCDRWLGTITTVGAAFIARCTEARHACAYPNGVFVKTVDIHVNASTAL